jgi:hypothetical protein
MHSQPPSNTHPPASTPAPTPPTQHTHPATYNKKTQECRGCPLAGNVPARPRAPPSRQEFGETAPPRDPPSPPLRSPWPRYVGPQLRACPHRRLVRWPCAVVAVLSQGAQCPVPTTSMWDVSASRLQSDLLFSGSQSEGKTQVFTSACTAGHPGDAERQPHGWPSEEPGLVRGPGAY